MKRVAISVVIAAQVMFMSAAAALTYQVTLDTTAFSGTLAQLSLAFTDGDAVSNTNSVSITNFATDGTLGPTVTPTGGVSGTLPGTVILTDTILFNEYLTDITLGTLISFRFTPTQNPSGGTVPDGLSVFLYDPGFVPLFDTTDPTGAGALFVFGIDGSAAGALEVFSAVAQNAGISVTAIRPTATPLPGTLLLILSGLLALFGLNRGRTLRAVSAS